MMLPSEAVFEVDIRHAADRSRLAAAAPRNDQSVTETGTTAAAR